MKEIFLKNPPVKSLRDIALETLRDAIITGDLKPGEHIKERDLSEKMEISTTPIKEALRILSYEGLVETRPRKGTFVSELVDSSIEEVLMVRARLEGLVANLAAKNITDEGINELEKSVLLMEELLKKEDLKKLEEINNNFHNKIREGMQNVFVDNIVMNLVTFDLSFRKRALTYSKEVEIGIKEHRSIFEAIKSRNPDLAEKRMKNHIERTAKNVLKNISY